MAVGSARRLASKVSVSVDMGSAVTGDAQRDAALPAPDWFDSAAHPKALSFHGFLCRPPEFLGGGDKYVAQARVRKILQSKFKWIDSRRMCEFVDRALAGDLG